MHWLPNRRAAARTNSGSRTAAELIDTLSHPASSNPRMSSIVRIPPPTVSGHEDLLSRPADDLQHNVAPLVAGGDVEKHQFVGAILLVTGRHGHRIAGVAEVKEISSLHHPTAVDVEARNDAFGKHDNAPANRRWLEGEKTPEVP